MAQDIVRVKQRGTNITLLTAYSSSTANIVIGPMPAWDTAIPAIPVFTNAYGDGSIASNHRRRTGRQIPMLLQITANSELQMMQIRDLISAVVSSPDLYLERERYYDGQKYVETVDNISCMDAQVPWQQQGSNTLFARCLINWYSTEAKKTRLHPDGTVEIVY